MTILEQSLQAEEQPDSDSIRPRQQGFWLPLGKQTVRTIGGNICLDPSYLDVNNLDITCLDLNWRDITLCQDIMWCINRNWRLTRSLCAVQLKSKSFLDKNFSKNSYFPSNCWITREQVKLNTHACLSMPFFKPSSSLIWH